MSMRQLRPNIWRCVNLYNLNKCRAASLIVIILKNVDNCVDKHVIDVIRKRRLDVDCFFYWRITREQHNVGQLLEVSFENVSKQCIFLVDNALFSKY